MLNLPNKISDDLALAVTVAGVNVDSYQYKIVSTPTLCSVTAGYSAPIDVSVPITDDLTSLSGSNTLCVRGLDNTNFEHQLFSSASTYTWTQSNSSIGFNEFNVNNTYLNWFDVEVSKWTGTPHIYARDFSGNIFFSDDRGVTFKNYCSLPHDAESRMFINRVSGLGAYATALGQLYRLDDMSGEACPRISSSFTNIVSRFQVAPVAFNSKGEIFVIDQVSASLSRIYRSSDRGATWVLVNSLTETMSNLTLSIDPFNDNVFMILYQGTPAAYSDRYIMSTDAGASFIGVRPQNDSVATLQNIRVDIKYDPANQGYAYSNNGQLTSNFFNSISGTHTSYVNDYSRWDIDQNGVGYRLSQNGADIDILRNSDVSNSTFIFYRKLTNITANSLNRTVSVSSDGATKVVVANRAMYISRDEGAFGIVYTPIKKLMISSLSSEDAANSYAVDFAWNFLKTSDSAASWSYVNSYSAGCAKFPKVRTTKTDSNYVLAYAEDASGSCANGIMSTNGLVSFDVRAFSSTSATRPSLALNPADKNSAAIVGNTTVNNSTDFLNSFSVLNVPNVSNVNHGFDAFISPLDPDLIYNVTGSSLYEINAVTLTKTNISASLTLTNPAGLESLVSNEVYVISSTGRMDRSLNAGGSYSSYSTANTLTSCGARFLKSHPDNRAQFFATACDGGQHVAYTLDSGATWKEIALNSFPVTNNCSIRDLALIGTGANKKIMLACRNIESIFIEMK